VPSGPVEPALDVALFSRYTYPRPGDQQVSRISAEAALVLSVGGAGGGGSVALLRDKEFHRLDHHDSKMPRSGRHHGVDELAVWDRYQQVTCLRISDVGGEFREVDLARDVPTTGKKTSSTGRNDLPNAVRSRRHAMSTTLPRMTKRGNSLPNDMLNAPEMKTIEK